MQPRSRWLALFMLAASVVITADAKAARAPREARTVASSLSTLSSIDTAEGKRDRYTWCAPEIETLPGEVCFLDGASKEAKRTLVVFLHGATAKNTTWSWNHERGLMRLAKGTGVDILYPRSPESAVGYVWPASLAAQETSEQALIDGWMATKRLLETRAGKRYDEVFVMGFSSGAYFVSSLALRGRMDVDGYAVFAGGGVLGQRPSPIARWSPVFVGVCADDDGSAAHGRAFAGALSAANIPRFVNEQHVGHGMSHVHFNNALSYLRHAH
jgi:predicted esterase